MHKRIVIIGASSAIAEHCARLWLNRLAAELILVGRNIIKLKRVAADLKVRNLEVPIHILQADFLDPDAIRSTVDGIITQGNVDIVLIAHGSLPEQANSQNDLRACHDSLQINALSPVLYAEAFATHMANANRGTIALIGSVAGDRGRKSNYIYGAAKGLIDHYVQGMQHRFAGSKVKIVLIKPGPTDTPMTAHLKEKGEKLASVEDVAMLIVKGIEKGSPIIYVPKKWRWIMCIIKCLPSFIFNKLNI